MEFDKNLILYGPPGTGKTNVIIEIILQILKANKKNPDVEPKKVLLVSQSHPAVDKMLEDLIMAATNEALRKCEEESQAQMSKITGGLSGLGGGLF